MATIKEVQIQNASGTGYDSRDIGAEAQYVDVSRDSNGDIITDLSTQTVATTETLAQTLKDLETDTAIDSALSTTSEHAVQNKVITGELNKKIPTYTSTPASWDTTPTASSTKPVTSGGIKTSEDGIRAIVAPLENGTAISQDYAAGEYFIRDGVRYKVLVDIAAGTIWASLSQGTDYVVADTVSSEVNELLGFEDTSLNMLGVKNLCFYPYFDSNMDKHGITAVVNSDGTVIFDGTATQDFGFNYVYLSKSCLYDFKGQKIKFSLGITMPQKMITFLQFLKNGVVISRTDIVEGETEKEILVPLDFDTMLFRSVIRSGGIVSNLKVYPMIYLASIKDNTYVPYARTNQELTSEVEPMLNVLGAKNILPNTATTQLVDGITFTVNSDGSGIYADGASTADQFSSCIISTSTYSKGKYVLSGCPSGGGFNKYGIYIVELNILETGEGIEFELSTDTVLTIMLVVYTAQGSVSWLLFRPMIRPASIQDDTYVPYAMTNRELTNNIQHNLEGGIVGYFATHTFQASELPDVSQGTITVTNSNGVICIKTVDLVCTPDVPLVDLSGYVGLNTYAYDSDGGSKMLIDRGRLFCKESNMGKRIFTFLY